MALDLLLSVPDEVLYLMLEFIALPTSRAFVLCHIISLLNSECYQKLEHERPVWFMMSKEYHQQQHHQHGVGTKKKRSARESEPRKSKRLRRSAKDMVREAHARLRERTETAHHLVAEMACSPNEPLSLKRLRSTLNRHGPRLRYDQQARIGGTFLVECCRARHATEKVVLSCVRELVERRGASTDVSSRVRLRATTESSSSSSSGGLTPLCIAAARGMSSVVRYLLRMGASPDLTASGSFRLHSNPTKSVTGTYTPLRFAEVMRDAEEINAKLQNEEVDLRSLNKCIRLLKKPVS